MHPKTFKLLWIDDEEENINILKPAIEQWVIDCSGNTYKLEILSKRTYDDTVFGIANDPLVHMIITDLNLLDGKNGAEFISKIRENEIYKDILLYSSDSVALAEKLKLFDGIHFYSFTDIFALRDKIQNVVWQCLIREQYVLARHEKKELEK